MGEGEDVPYRDTDSRRCGLGGTRRAGPGSVLGVWVTGTRCRMAKRVVRRYQRCLNREGGRKGRCYGRVDTRCVRRVFLGRCWLRDRFYRRRVMGYHCTEWRVYELEDLYEGRVICRRGRRRVSHSYTLLGKEPVSVDTEKELRAAWANPRVNAIDVTADIFLRACEIGDPLRESARPMLLDGAWPHAAADVLREAAAATGRHRIRGAPQRDSHARGQRRSRRGGHDQGRDQGGRLQSARRTWPRSPAAESFSMRRATIVRSVITGNLANDDGGGVYARRGGVQVFDSIVNGNLVDGSGGAIGSTGDILVVRSHVDGNTTDGDGGALYADEDGDVTVIDSTVDGSDADGPGGGIFTLEGDVTIVNSTVNGNRADDRGGAISGEATVTVINSTIARNAAVAHVGGGIWARGDRYVVNSTVATTTPREWAAACLPPAPSASSSRR